MKWGLGQTSDMEQEVEHRKHLPQLESTGSRGQPDACPTASLHRDPAMPETEAQRDRGWCKATWQVPLHMPECLRVASPEGHLGQHSSRKTSIGVAVL